MFLHEKIITIIIVIIATMLTRFIPFLIFKKDSKTPDYIIYLGYALPPAIFGMLVIYSLKDMNISSSNIFGIPEVISIMVIVVLHNWKRNMFLSMISGTVLYIILNSLI